MSSNGDTPSRSKINNHLLPSSAKTINCGNCREMDNEDMVQCDKCDMWYHFSCVKVTHEIADYPWNCKKCEADELLDGTITFTKTNESKSRSSRRSKRTRELEIQKLEEERVLQQQRDKEYLDKKYQLLESHSTTDEDPDDDDGNISSSLTKVDKWLSNKQNVIATRSPPLMPTSNLSPKNVSSVQISSANLLPDTMHLNTKMNLQELPTLTHRSTVPHIQEPLVTNHSLSRNNLDVQHYLSTSGMQFRPQPSVAGVVDSSSLIHKLKLAETSRPIEINQTAHIESRRMLPPSNQYCDPQKLLMGNITSQFAGLNTVSNNRHDIAELTRSTNTNKQPKLSHVQMPSQYNMFGEPEMYRSTKNPPEYPNALATDNEPPSVISLSAQHLAARHAISKELPIFSGRSEEWPLFISAYETSTRTCNFSNDENLVRLQRSLKGRALSLSGYFLEDRN